MSESRVARVRRILNRDYPYRTTDKAIRRIVATLPNPRKQYRATQDRFIAVVVALPFRLERK